MAYWPYNFLKAPLAPIYTDFDRLLAPNKRLFPCFFKKKCPPPLENPRSPPPESKTVDPNSHCSFENHVFRGRESNRTRKTKSAASLSHLFKANNNINNNNNNNPNNNTNNNNSNGTASSLSHSVVNTLRRKSKSRQRSSSKASSGASSSSRLQLFLGGENSGSHYVVSFWFFFQIIDRVEWRNE